MTTATQGEGGVLEPGRGSGQGGSSQRTSGGVASVGTGITVPGGEDVGGAQLAPVDPALVDKLLGEHRSVLRMCTYRVSKARLRQPAPPLAEREALVAAVKREQAYVAAMLLLQAALKRGVTLRVAGTVGGDLPAGAGQGDSPTNAVVA